MGSESKQGDPLTDKPEFSLKQDTCPVDESNEWVSSNSPLGMYLGLHFAWLALEKAKKRVGLEAGWEEETSSIENGQSSIEEAIRYLKTQFSQALAKEAPLIELNDQQRKAPLLAK